MTDEVFGRAWAKQMRISPEPPGSMSDWGWWWHAGRTPSAVVAEMIRERAGAGWPHFATESDCFAALGRAVRAVHAAVPPLESPS